MVYLTGLATLYILCYLCTYYQNVIVDFALMGRFDMRRQI